MLSDYHLHLRPDDRGATPAEYFTAANAERYRETRALHDAAPSTPERRELLFQLTADVGLFNRGCPSLRIEAADCATVAW